MKMKVGDIEMNSQTGIHFGTPPPPTTQVIPAPSSSSGFSLPQWSPGRLLFVAAIAGAGAIALTLLALITSTFLFLIPLPGLLPLSIGACLLAIIGHRREAMANPTDPIDLSQVAIERRARVFNLLQQTDTPMTVESLQTQLKWTDTVLLTALSELLAQQRITEDLDLDSGHWVYQITTTSPALHHQPDHVLPVQERLHSIASPARITHKD